MGEARLNKSLLEQQNRELCNELETALAIIERQHEFLTTHGIDPKTGAKMEDSKIIIANGR